MKKILTLLLVVASFSVFAQENPVSPVYFISGELASADGFNNFLQQSLPGLQLKSKDVTKDKTWDFVFTGNAGGNMAAAAEELKVSYYIDNVPGNNDVKGNGGKNITHLEIKGDFATLSKLYNKLFNNTLTAEQIQQNLPIRGPIKYGKNDKVWNKNNYWFSFANFNPGGYCMIFRQTKA